MAEIQFLSGPLDGKRIELSNESTIMGRNPDTHIPLDDVAASGQHAELRTNDGRWQVRDLDSSNGTRLNGKPVEVKMTVTVVFKLS